MTGPSLFRHIRRTCLPLFAGVLFFTVSHSAWAIDWDANGANPPDGIFAVANNWNPDQVPGVGDTTVFSLADTYTVTLDGNAASDILQVLSGEVTLVSDSATVRQFDLITGSGLATVLLGGTLNIGSATNPVFLNVGDLMHIGPGGGNGTVVLSGADSRLDALGTGQNIIGNFGLTGMFSVTSGATANYGINGTLVVANPGTGGTQGIVAVNGAGTLNTGHIDIASGNSGNTGSMTVSGSGSLIEQTLAGATLVVGGLGDTGIINVESSGTFTTGTGTTTINALGTLNIGVVGSGTFNANGNVNVDGGTINVGATGNFNPSTGQTLTAQNNALVDFTSGFAINDNTTVAVNSGADMSVGGTVTVGNTTGATGTLNITAGGIFSAADITVDSTGSIAVSGAGTDVDVSGSFELIGLGATPVTMTVDSLAQVNTGVLDLGDVLSSGSGSLSILSDADVTSSVARIRGGSDATIDGNGSTWGTGGLEVGPQFNTGSGLGSLVIQNGADMTTSGEINVDSIAGSGDISLITVDGAGSTLTATGNNFRALGENGSGAIHILNGGNFTNTAFSMSIGRGEILVDGPGSTWADSSGLVFVGGGINVIGPGNGSLTIQNSGIASHQNDVDVGRAGGDIGTVLVDGTGSQWDVTGSIEIFPNSVMTVSNSATVTSEGSGSVGTPEIHDGATVTVSGAGSSWTLAGTNSFNTAVGGTLVIESGGTVDLTAPVASNRLNGDTSVNGSGSLLQITSTIDLQAGAIVSVSNGGDVIGTTIFSSANAGPTITIEDPNSTWTTTGHTLFQGVDIQILNGGAMSGATADIGNDPGIATVLVDGTDSVWSLSDHVDIEKADITITGGGELSAESVDFVGSIFIPTVVDGTGSNWTTTNTLNLSSFGPLQVTNGGLLSAGDIIVGAVADAGVVASEATVSGLTSQISSAGSLVVGEVGTAPMILTVVSGATATSATGIVGNQLGSDGAVTVDGAGSNWAVSSGLTVANNGTAALNILNGGAVTNGNVGVGVGASGTGTVLVDGAGSTWDSTTVTVADGAVGVVTVQNDADATSTFLTLADGSTGDGTVTVTGPGSTWNNTNDTLVGGDGTGALNVQNGGLFTTGNTFVAAFGGSNGTLTVETSGATLDVTNSLDIGTNGTGVMNVNVGGIVTVTNNLDVGATGTLNLDGGDVTTTNFDSSAGTLNFVDGLLTVDGGTYDDGVDVALDGVGGADNPTLRLINGASATPTGDTIIGSNNNATLLIESGSSVTNATGLGVIGDFSSTSNGNVTVDGLGSIWSASSFSVGSLGVGTLTISDQGTVSSANTTFIGIVPGAVGTVVVDGIGSSLSSLGILRVGIDGDGILQIQNGGSVTNADASISSGSGTLNTASVDGAGSNWTSNGKLTVGNSSAPAQLTVTNGGTVSSDSGLLGQGFTSNGSALIENSASNWTIANDLQVGLEGTASLTVKDGGTVTNIDAFVGEMVGADGTVLVTGTSALWDATGSVYVGGDTIAAGGTGTVTMLPGGTARVGNTLKIWDDGTVNLFGGALSLANAASLVKAGSTFAFASGVLELREDSLLDPTFLNNSLGGSSLVFGQELLVLGQATLLTPLSIDGGQLTANSLSQAALLQLNSGTLHLTNQPLVVELGGLFGDTLDVAAGMTIQIDLGITNNRVITGDGQIIGTVTNSSSGEVRVAGGQSLRFSGGTLANAGKLEAIGGELEFNQNVANAVSTGLITGRDATLRFSGGLANDGSLALSFGTSDIFGDITNSATGAIAVGGNSQATFFDDVANGGALNVATGSTAVFLGALTGNGNSGGGDVQALGDLVPGASPGEMVFGGDLVLGTLSVLEAELGGTLPGIEFDVVTVVETATLNGVLNVTLIDGFIPSLGDKFEIISTSGGIVGTFASELLPLLGSNVELQAIYDTSTVTLAVVPSLPGDFDIDGDVDGLDFLTWQRGPSVGALSDWEANYGMVAPLSTASAAVPEPTSLLIAVMAYLAGCCRKRQI